MTMVRPAGLKLFEDVAGVVVDVVADVGEGPSEDMLDGNCDKTTYIAYTSFIYSLRLGN